MGGGYVGALSGTPADSPQAFLTNDPTELVRCCSHSVTIPGQSFLLEMNNCLVKIFEQRITRACIFLGKVSTRSGGMMGPPRTIRLEKQEN